MKLVVHPPVETARLSRIREAAGRMDVVNAEDGPTALREIGDADAFFGKLTPELLRQARQLRWVQSPTASLEHYLFPELIEHPCVVTNMRGLFSDVIADHVLGFVLCFARNLHTYLAQQATGTWAPVGGETERATFTSGPGTVNEIDRRHLHLADCTLGVVGVGQIGAEIARRARAFGMTVIGVDPVVTATDAIESVWPLERLGDLLGVSDFVVIAAPHASDNARMIAAPQLRQMKRSAYLINIGRGVLVDLTALTEALQAGTLAGAAFDVFEIEPLPTDHPLWRMPNVILTPHIAGTSPRIAERHTGVLLENVRRFAAGEPLVNMVDKRRWF
ncbi:D-2-hydroxyacid dehydrogenase [Planctomyces sp. SH-PL14]|uniref:D-2-hydroxyacid dehydrogenase n=1 Tax=Planctomyces sp. SH-PL14 TaxID=1632864 RepID=UPI00078D3423|nr:D-2-hydroxyacid dehydrogenase [Planctomyces sp. SH-PL14]AMV17228.1 Glycerate dehydrogenase [Planctomyces sp. SH-PL14]